MEGLQSRNDRQTSFDCCYLLEPFYFISFDTWHATARFYLNKPVMNLPRLAIISAGPLLPLDNAMSQPKDFK